MAMENKKKYNLYLNEYYLSEIDSTIIQVDMIDIAKNEIVRSEKFKFFSMVSEYKDFLYDFLDNLPKYVKENTKAAVITMFEMNQETYAAVMNPIEKVKIEFDKFDISSRFMMKEEFYATGLLEAANYKPRNGETLMTIICCPEKVRILELLRESGGYKVIRRADTKSLGSSLLEVKKTILGNTKPNQIIIGSIKQNSKIDVLKKVFDSPDVIMVEKFLNEYIPETIKAVIDGISEINLKFHIQPICNNTFAISPANDTKLITITESNFYLPVWDEFELPNKGYNLLVKHPFKTNDAFNILETTAPEPGKKVKNVKVSLIIHNDCIPILRKTKDVIDKISPLVKSLNTKANKKIPTLILNNNSTICAIWNEKENSFEAIKTWAGKEDRPDYLSFDEGEKPKIGKDAKDVLDYKPNSVVYDLLKIMAMPPNNIKTDQKWKFKVSKNDENQIFIEFENFEGISKKASPTFLFAFLLKHHRKIIENKTGIQPKEITVCLNYGKENAEHIKKQISEAAKKINLICLFLV